MTWSSVQSRWAGASMRCENLTLRNTASLLCAHWKAGRMERDAAGCASVFMSSCRWRRTEDAFWCTTWLTSSPRSRHIVTSFLAVRHHPRSIATPTCMAFSSVSSSWAALSTSLSAAASDLAAPRFSGVAALLVHAHSATSTAHKARASDRTCIEALLLRLAGARRSDTQKAPRPRPRRTVCALVVRGGVAPRAEHRLAVSPGGLPRG